MFKPGDLALVVATGKKVLIEGYSQPDKLFVETNAGAFQESELLQAHPTVLTTARAEDDYEERYEREILASRPRKSVASIKLHTNLTSLLESSNSIVDLKGHWKRGRDLREEPRLGQGMFRSLFVNLQVPDKDVEALLEALPAKSPIGRWIDLGRSCIESYDGCPYCGKRRFSLQTNGEDFQLSGEECKYPDGLPSNEWELNVPSGRIVVANDLRKWFPLPNGDPEGPSINQVLGCRLTTEAYSKTGLSHAFVGNTCPGIFRTDSDNFKIAYPPSEEYWDKDRREYLPRDPKPIFEGEQIASICTDLWWYSLCDEDEFNRRIEKFGGSLEEAEATIISVRPGVYLFKHNDGITSNDSGSEILFTTFNWIREPDPTTDYLGAYQEIEVNAHAYVQAQVKKWPTLYGVCPNHEEESALLWSDMTEEQQTHSWQRVANHIFCVIGGGTDWHEKGFPTSKVDTSILDIEPPQFRQQYHWYPFSESYGGLFRSGELAPSFAKLAFRLLESVVSFGMDVHDGQHSREVRFVRKRMLLAVKRYRELATKYPDLADPDYVWWLGQEGRAEAWIERFDLGPTFTDKHREHAASQRWVPEDTYAIEFDARKLKDGYFAWASGCWARKEDAARYAIEEWHDNGQVPEHNCFWTVHAKDTAIPLYSVARVIKIGEVSHMGETLIELAFDYGTKWMKDPSKRKAVRERAEKDAIRILTKDEYEELLPRAKRFKCKEKK